ncbi:hypothetical protein [Desulfovibrio cuneatus]|uniref:hypothetical protein n=1 Tax=Desulfovibrio cuneatus TaxID=159728 RepID=UPI0012EC20C6|nr:hypothetical protein [Desulfovibrio cuneatus]
MMEKARKTQFCNGPKFENRVRGKRSRFFVFARKNGRGCVAHRYTNSTRSPKTKRVRHPAALSFLIRISPNQATKSERN